MKRGNLRFRLGYWEKESPTPIMNGLSLTLETLWDGSNGRLWIIIIYKKKERGESEKESGGLGGRPPGTFHCWWMRVLTHAIYPGVMGDITWVRAECTVPGGLFHNHILQVI